MSFKIFSTLFVHVRCLLYLISGYVKICVVYANSENAKKEYKTGRKIEELMEHKMGLLYITSLLVCFLFTYLINGMITLLSDTSDTLATG